MTELTQFFQAVEAGDIDGVRGLLAAHPELARARDDRGATALHLAALVGNRELVGVLRESGADLNARDSQFDATTSGWAIHYLRELGGLLAIEIEDVLHAIRRRDVEWAKRLVTRHPALIDATDAQGTRLADHACASDMPEIVRLFEKRDG